MSRRVGVVGLAASVLIACVCAGLVAWRLSPPRPRAPAPVAPVSPGPVAAPEPPVRLSTIIDLPGDPVLVRRGAVLAPKDALISVPANFGQQAPQTPAKALFVNSTLDLDHRRLYGQVSGGGPGGRGAGRAIRDELGASRRRAKRARLRLRR